MPQMGDGGRSPAAASAAARALRTTSLSSPARPPTLSETAWFAAVPTAAIVVLAIVLVGPPLGRTLFAPANVRFWRVFQFEVYPEPVEQGRFLIALAAPLLLATLTFAGARARPRLPPAAIDRLVVAIQAAAVGFVVLCVLQQRQELLGPLYAAEHAPVIRLRFFTGATLLAAAGGTVALAWAIGARRLRAALTGWTRETRARRIAAGSVAVGAIVVWLLHAVYTEATIEAARSDVLYHIQFVIDETFAVLDGRTPLVNFAAQYGSLGSYAFAAGMSLLGDSIGAWVAMALVATGLGMLAIFAVLRRAAGSSIRGLALFLPVLATSFFMVRGPLEDRYTYANYFGTFPLRYAGPSLLAWLVARHLGGAWPRRAWPLFVVAGVVVLNNADVGVAAVGATVAALLWGAQRLTRKLLVQLALEAVAGLLVAYALVSLLTLARAGSLPDLGLLLRFSRLFGLTGFGLFAMPTIGLHLVVYLTLVAALGVATVRALRGEPERLLTGMLAWSAIFGLGAGTYFAGRSTPENLVAMFFPWSFALALLLIPAVRSLGVAWWRRRPPVAALACLFGFVVMACSLAQTPTPWEQLARLRRSGQPTLAAPPGQPFVAQHTHRGEVAAILLPLGHRIGANLGVTDISPYADVLSMPTVEQWDETIAALRAAGGRKLFVRRDETSNEMRAMLTEAGFAFVGQDAGDTDELWLAGG
jgi:hypothetical protein